MRSDRVRRVAENLHLAERVVAGGLRIYNIIDVNHAQIERCAICVELGDCVLRGDARRLGALVRSTINFVIHRPGSAVREDTALDLIPLAGRERDTGIEPLRRARTRQVDVATKIPGQRVEGKANPVGPGLFCLDNDHAAAGAARLICTRRNGLYIQSEREDMNLRCSRDNLEPLICQRRWCKLEGIAAAAFGGALNGRGSSKYCVHQTGYRRNPVLKTRKPYVSCHAK